jgi:hypothetical protein
MYVLRGKKPVVVPRKRNERSERRGSVTTVMKGQENGGETYQALRVFVRKEKQPKAMYGLLRIAAMPTSS